MVKSKAKVQQENARSNIGKPTFKPETNSKRQTKEIIDKIIKGDPTDLTCKHFMAGSSNIHAILSGKYSFRRVHSRLMTKRTNKAVGVIGERACYYHIRKRMRPTAGRHLGDPLIEPLIRLPEAKFILACPDFYFRLNGESLIAEVKTTTMHDKLQTSIPNRVLLQIWIAMDAFNVNKCELTYLRLEGDDARTISHLVDYIIEKKCRFFDLNTFEDSLWNFGVMIKSYLEFNGVPVSRSDMTYFRSEALKKFKSFQIKSNDYVHQNLFCDNIQEGCKLLTTFMFPRNKGFENLLEYPNWGRESNKPKSTWQERQEEKHHLVSGTKIEHEYEVFTSKNTVLDENRRSEILVVKARSVDKMDIDRLNYFKAGIEEINSRHNISSKFLTVDKSMLLELIFILNLKLESAEHHMQVTDKAIKQLQADVCLLKSSVFNLNSKDSKQLVRDFDKKILAKDELNASSDSDNDSIVEY